MNSVLEKTNELVKLCFRRFLSIKPSMDSVLIGWGYFTTLTVLDYVGLNDTLIDE
jgi:hypothetical protein